MTVWTFTQEAPSASQDGTIDYLNYVSLILGLPLLTAITWFLFIGMSESINNCSTIFGSPSTCYTSALLTTTTATIYGFNFSFDLGLLGYAWVVFLLITFVVRVFVFFNEVVRKGGMNARKGTSSFFRT